MRLRPRLAAGFVSLALSASFAAAASAQGSGDSPEGEILRNAQQVKKLLGSRVERLRTSAGNPSARKRWVGAQMT